MGVYKKNRNWYIDYYVNYKRYRECVGPGTKRDAEKALSKRKVQIKENRIFDKKRICHLMFEEMVEEYLRYSKGHKKDPVRDRVSCKALLSHFKDCKIRDIQPSDVEDYKRVRCEVRKKNGTPLAVSTVNRELTCLKAMFNRLIRDRKIDFNPAQYVKKFNEESLQRDLILSSEEYERFLAAASADTREIIEVAFRTAMRRKELLGLTWEQVDLKGGYINLAAKDTKTNHKRVIPLDNRVMQILKGRIRRIGCPYVFHKNGKKLGSIKTAFNAACRRAEIEDFRLHDVRHMAITRLVKAKLPESAIMLISGHRTRKVFDRYVNLKPDDVKGMLSALDREPRGEIAKTS